MKIILRSRLNNSMVLFRFQRVSLISQSWSFQLLRCLHLYFFWNLILLKTFLNFFQVLILMDLLLLLQLQVEFLLSFEGIVSFDCVCASHYGFVAVKDSYLGAWEFVCLVRWGHIRVFVESFYLFSLFKLLNIGTASLRFKNRSILLLKLQVLLVVHIMPASSDYNSWRKSIFSTWSLLTFINRRFLSWNPLIKIIFLTVSNLLLFLNPLKLPIPFFLTLLLLIFLL